MSIDLIKNRYKEELISYGIKSIEFNSTYPLAQYYFTFIGSFQEEITIRVKINDLDSIETKIIDIIGTLDKHLELRDESNNNI